MWKKLKKFFAFIIIVVLVPYVTVIMILPKDVATSAGVRTFQEELDEYCIQKLAEEVSSDYEMEMLKVQAILVRTTVFQQVQEEGEEFSWEMNLEESKELDFLWRQKLKKAWQETEGQVVMYNGKLALVPFHQVSNGKTRNGAEVLGSDEYPYLKSMECPKDVEAENQMESCFIEATNINISKEDSTGYVLELKVGEEVCSGESFRNTYRLASSCFELQNFENQTRVITKGVGHGLGLSQYTANEMAKEGKRAEEILQFFFEGTEIKEVAEILWNLE